MSTEIENVDSWLSKPCSMIFVYTVQKQPTKQPTEQTKTNQTRKLPVIKRKCLQI